MAVIHDTTMSPGKLELLAVSNTPDPAVTGLSVPWRLPDGPQVRGILATADYTPVSGP